MIQVDVVKYSIAIQGPTDFCKEVMPKISSNYEVVWATWDDEPVDNLSYISGLAKLVTIKKPQSYGYGNVNMQSFSSRAAIKFSTGEYVLKIRSDIKCSDYDTLFAILSKSSKKLQFLCYHEHDGGYPVDYINFGARNDILELWDYEQVGFSDVFAERQIYNNWMEKNRRHTGCEDSRTDFGYFLKEALEYGVKFEWIKKGIELSSYLNDNKYISC